MFELNKKHERAFWKAVTEFVAKLRVVDWTIRTDVKDMDPVDDRTLADCQPDPDFAVATITLYRNWEKDPTPEHIKETAFHEVLHVVMSRLMELARERYVTEKQLDDEEHEVIRRIVSYVFKKGTTSEWTDVKIQEKD